jgi:hypothetical protein
MDIIIETITPIIADEYLKMNLNKNRPLSEPVMERYAAEMTAGMWKLTGDPIRFDVNYNLIDGQHRLHALIRSKKSLEFLVIRGLPIESFSLIDTGKIRNAGDVLAIDGYKHTTTLAGAIRMLEILKNIPDEGLVNIEGVSKRNGVHLSNQAILDLSRSNPSLQRDVTKICCNYQTLSRLIGRAAAVALYHLFQKKDPELTDVFFNKLNSGNNLSDDSVIYALREKLINNLSSIHKYSIGYRVALVICAWNFFRRRGEKVQLRISPELRVMPIL